MKKISAVWITAMLLLLSIIRVNAQQQTELAPNRVAVGYVKTTSLIFPYAIKSVDKGSKDILVQKAKGVENILQLKAATENFMETSITVVTADGNLYNYLAYFNPSPPELVIAVDVSAARKSPVAVFSEDATTSVIEEMADKVLFRSPFISKMKDAASGIKLSVAGMYIHEDVLYLQLFMANHSPINYDVQLLRLFIRDKKKSKRTASQEMEIVPLYMLGNAKLVRSYTRQPLTIAVPKFTIPDKKYLIIQMMEQDGGRHLQIRINNSAVIRSRPVY